MVPADMPRFRSTLAMLRDRFEFVTFRQAVELATSGETLDGRAVAFSFDDGFRDNHDLIAPVLDEYGTNACFFLATNFINCSESYRRDFLRTRVFVHDDRHPMDWAMVRELHQLGFEFGAHTTDHVNLAECDHGTAVMQIEDSKRAIERELGVNCEWFAWPYGLPQHFPSTLLQHASAAFSKLFSAQRSKTLFDDSGAVIHRDHFEPGWPTSHVKYFAGRRVSRIKAERF